MKRIILLILLLLGGVAQAGDTGYLVRATELKAKPFADAPTVATAPDQAKVEVLSRQSSWMQIKSEAGTGWVKMLSVRLGTPGAAPKGDSGGGLGNLFNLATTGKSGSTVTTGVRGLSEEKLKNVSPNPEAFKTMKTFAAKKDDAQKFAKAGQLKSEKVEYMDASKTTDSDAKDAGDK